MQAWLQISGLWRLVNGTYIKPSTPSPPTESDLVAEEAWQSKADKAAGWLYLMVEPVSRNKTLVIEWHRVVLETPLAGAFVSDIYI